MMSSFVIIPNPHLPASQKAMFFRELSSAVASKYNKDWFAESHLKGFIIEASHQVQMARNSWDIRAILTHAHSLSEPNRKRCLGFIWTKAYTFETIYTHATRSEYPNVSIGNMYLLISSEISVQSFQVIYALITVQLAKLANR